MNRYCGTRLIAVASLFAAPTPSEDPPPTLSPKVIAAARRWEGPSLDDLLAGFTAPSMQAALDGPIDAALRDGAGLSGEQVAAIADHEDRARRAEKQDHFDDAALEMAAVIKLREQNQLPQHWQVAGARFSRARFERIAARSPTDRARVLESYETAERADGAGEAGRHFDAAEMLVEALSAIEPVLGVDSIDGSVLLHNLAIDMERAGEPKLAAGLYRRVFDIRKRQLGDDHPMLGVAMNSLAANLGRTGETRRAEPLARRAVLVLRQAYGEVRSETASAMNTLSLLAADAGELSAATTLSERVRAALVKTLGPRDPTVALMDMNFSFLLSSIGEFDRAEEMLRHAIAQLQGVLGPEHPQVLLAKINLAECVRWQGALDEAVAVLEEVAATAERLGFEDTDWYAESRLNGASLAYELNDLTSALRLARESYDRDLARFGEQHARVATAMNLMGLVHAAMGDREQAQRDHRQALAVQIRQRGESSPETATVALNLGLLLIAEIDPAQQAEGHDLIRTALDARRRAGVQELALGASAYAEALCHGKRWEDSKKLFEEAVQQIERLRLQVTGDELDRARYSRVALRFDPYGGMARAILHSADGKTPAATVQALTWMERGRGRGLLDLLLRGRDESDRKALAETIVQPLGAEDIRSHLRDGELLLAYDIGERESTVFLLRRDTHTQACALHWPDGAPVTADSLRQALQIEDSAIPVQASARRTPAASQRAAAHVFPAIVPAALRTSVLAARRVIVVPHGILNAVALDSLPIDPESGRLWIDAGPPISVAPSATIFALKRVPGALTGNATSRESTSSGPAATAAVLLGDPVFRAGDGVPTKALASRVRSGSSELASLPGSATEIDAIRRQLRRSGLAEESIVILRREEATVTHLAEAVRRPTFLHLATHGIVEGGPRVRLSALALAPGREPSTSDAGRLQLADLLRDWRGKLEGTRLVALSACRTAHGRFDLGEGFVGLTWGFLYAGADSVLASLWKVDDGATVLLMDRFYENLLGNFDRPRAGFAEKTPMPKAEALHEAKRWLRTCAPGENRAALAALGLEPERLLAARGESGSPSASAADAATVRLPTDSPEPLADPFDYSHPRFWAAFILIGNPD